MPKEDFAGRRPGLIGQRQLGQYAVLAPLLETPEGMALLFEKRTDKLDRQPGEICFPGGKLEPNETLQECAVRETCEELLIKPEQIEVLGPGDIFITHFNVMLHTFIGTLSDYQYTFNTDEVSEIITVPLSFLRDRDPDQYETKLSLQVPDDFPYERIPGGANYPWAIGTHDILFYEYDEHVIWGMTAMLVYSVIELIDQYDLVGRDRGR